MLTYTLVTNSGEEMPLKTVLTALLDCDVGVPAASLTLTCPFNKQVRSSAAEIRAFDGDTLIFRGALDNIVTVKRAQGVILKLNARSPAAALLDNEAEPLVYKNPGATLIENKHLKPFGIALADGDRVPYYDKMTIDKGMSHWQVIKRFCRCRYGSEPYVTADGVMYLHGVQATETAVFSDCGEGIAYRSLKESVRRHRLISEVRVKFRHTNNYCSYVGNPNPEARQVKRVRYVNAAANHTTLSTAYRILENGNRDSYAMTLDCPGCHIAALGQHAGLVDSAIGTLDGLRVEKVRYTADSRGEHSEITLKKENFDVADELHNQ